MSRSAISSTLCTLLLIASASCNKSNSSDNVRQTPAERAPIVSPATPATVQPTAASGSGEAETIFKQRCAVCHGQDGRGDGPGAAALNPKPRDYTDAAWQDSVSDEQIAKTIVAGGAAVGKSPNMAPNPDLATKPDVVRGLVAIVRSFKAGAAK